MVDGFRTKSYGADKQAFDEKVPFFWGDSAQARLPRLEIVHDLHEQDKTSCDGKRLIRIGEQINSQALVGSCPPRVNISKHFTAGLTLAS